MSRQQTNFARSLPLIASSVVIAGDRVSKLYIQHSMGTFDAVPVLPGWLRIIHTENPGAAFGFLAEGNPLLRSVVLVGVSAVVLVFVASALFTRNHAFSSTLTRLGLSLILGGAAGNLYDRLTRGTVTDFVEFYHRTWSFPAFNVADSAITTGAILLLLDLLRTQPKALDKRPEFAGK